MVTEMMIVAAMMMGVGGFHGDDVDDGPINSGSSDDELNMVIF